MSAQAQTFWLQWVKGAFPDLDSRVYFLPPVYFNRVPTTTESISGQDVMVLRSPSVQAPKPTFQDSDVRDDAAMQRVLICLQKMAEHKGEVMVGLSQLQFGEYLGEPCYAAAAAQLPLPANLPPALPRNWKRGDFDVLLIHRHYGFIICEVKAFGDNIKHLSMAQQDINKNIKKKLQLAITQLDKAEAMLSHLVSDIAPGLRINKVIAVPNLTACQVQQVISSDHQLTQYLTRPLRSPPVVVREVGCDVHITQLREVMAYSERGVPGHTDGPPVRRLYHRGEHHSGDWPYDCATCGVELASFLHSLRVGVTENNTTSPTVTCCSSSTTLPCLQWKDVLMVYWLHFRNKSGMVSALRRAGIPVRIMKTKEDFNDVVLARSDVVWVADGHRVHGLERKVVVCLEYYAAYVPLHVISRCTSQLVICSLDRLTP